MNYPEFCMQAEFGIFYKNIDHQWDTRELSHKN